MYVTPKPGVRVYDPERQCFLAPAGAHVPRTSYWIRRLMDGAVLEAMPPRDDESQLEPDQEDDQ